MAVTVIIIATLSIIATVMAVLALMPVIQDMGTDANGSWSKQQDLINLTCNPLDSECLERQVNAVKALSARDKAFTAIVALPIFLIGAIVAWAFLAVTRRDFGEV